MTVKPIIKKCLQLYQDLGLQSVKDWKEKNNAKAIGFLPVYVPREIIHAAGMLPVGIMGGGDATEIIRGDAYFQSYICRIPRSTIELGLSGHLNSLDGLLFPAICDVIRNLSGMWKIIFPTVYVKYMDLPQNFGPAGENFYTKEIETLIHDFEKISGNQITPEKLNHAIELYNENTKTIQELYDLRANFPHQVFTYETYLLMRASNLLEVSEHTRMLKEYMAAVVHENRPNRDHVRVVVSGAFCEQPPLNMIRALENSGCYIVDDDWMLGAHYILDPIVVNGNPLNAIIKAYLGNTVSTASRYEYGPKKGRFLIEQVKNRHAEGVVFAAPSFCDPALLERPMLQDILNQEGIPHTAFQYAENTGQIQVIKEQTGTFADSIKLWGHHEF